MKNILNQHKSIIVLNGTAPNKKLIPFLNTNVPIIAADGGYAKALILELKPTYLVGDGDSCTKDLSTNTQRISISCQDSTDFEKCILFAKENNLFPALVLGISGGEIDHTLGNMQALLKYAQDLNLYFLDTYEKSDAKEFGIKIGIPLTCKTLLDVYLMQDSLISLLPYQHCFIKSSGLQWELGDFPLTHDGILGVRNVNIREHVSFEVKEGRALLVIDISKYKFLMP